jgi:hypothetical protein
MIEIKQSKILVVEGMDEELFFSAIVKNLNLQGIQILGIGGKTKIRPNLKALQISPNFSIVTSSGIIRDADDNANSAFQSVCSALENAGFPQPSQSGHTVGISPTVSVLILPDGQSPGMLEDVCLQSIVTHPILPCINQYLACVEGATSVLPSNISKAKIHAYLAAQSSPGKRLGESASTNYWQLTDQAFNGISQFLRSL